jgi:hypothetical protein
MEHLLHFIAEISVTSQSAQCSVRRYFLLWYQALGDNAPDNIHAICATLVPGFPSPFPGQGLPALNRSSTSVFHDTSHGEFVEWHSSQVSGHNIYR